MTSIDRCVEVVCLPHEVMLLNYGDTATCCYTISNPCDATGTEDEASDAYLE